jgi:hypothetical protein
VLRREHLGNAAGAAEDLKRLHEQSPGDDTILRQLEGLYNELGDYRGLVQLYEDQILRGRDPNARADLARRVALLWRDSLNDARETADAWRRVLRMRPGDSEAKEGLAAAKRAMPYRRTPSGAARPRGSAQPPPVPSTPPPRHSSVVDLAGPPPSSHLVESADFDLDEDEEVRDEDLALDDDVDAAFDASTNGSGGDDALDVDIELDDEDEEELDPVTTVDERGVMQYAEAGAGPGRRLRPPPLNKPPSGSQTAKRKRPRKRARATADTGVHRKPNVSRRSRKS